MYEETKSSNVVLVNGPRQFPIDRLHVLGVKSVLIDRHSPTRCDKQKGEDKIRGTYRHADLDDLLLLFWLASEVL